MNVVDLTAKVVSQVGDQTLTAHGIPGGGPVIDTVVRDLLGTFVEVQDEQKAALQRLEGTLQRVVDQPWQTARRCLVEAQVPGRSPDAVQASLQKAADYLREAVDLQDPNTFARAYACLDLALVLILLGNEAELVRHYSAQASEEAGDRMAAIRDERLRRKRSPLHDWQWRVSHPDYPFLVWPSGNVRPRYLARVFERYRDGGPPVFEPYLLPNTFYRDVDRGLFSVLPCQDHPEGLFPEYKAIRVACWVLRGKPRGTAERPAAPWLFDWDWTFKDIATPPGLSV